MKMKTFDQCPTCNPPREQWGEGPWQQEPDRVEFMYDGFDCLLHRNWTGVWCGYVGVKPGHPMHGKPYGDLNLDAHGGLTYSDGCHGCICHESAGGDKLWWLGFDCGHGGDLVPAMGRALDCMTYRDMDYAIAQVKGLAVQLRWYVIGAGCKEGADV